MARIESHMNDCKRLLGDTCQDVHLFLDKYAEIFLIQQFGEYHRSFLHNKYGIEVAKARWGLIGEKAATIHIVRDYVEMPIKSFKVVDQYFNRAMKYFNNLTNFDIDIPPHVIRAWDGKGLVTVATRI